MNPKLARKATHPKMQIGASALDPDPSQTQLFLVNEMLGRQEKAANRTGIMKNKRMSE